MIKQKILTTDQIIIKDQLKKLIIVIVALLSIAIAEFAIKQGHYDIGTQITSMHQKEINLIRRMILKVTREDISIERVEMLAQLIWKTSHKYHIHPKIMIAIIDTESDFLKGKVSTTGDLSLAQINPKVWNRELVRLNKEPLDCGKLHQDEEYALERMGEILKIIKDRYRNKDYHWYARYHSNTKKFKTIYQQKLQNKLNLLAQL